MSRKQSSSFNASTFRHGELITVWVNGRAAPAIFINDEAPSQTNKQYESKSIKNTHADYNIFVLKQTNTRKCGYCGETGHYKNNCPMTVNLPKKKTSVWNMTHKTQIIMKYRCECGKQEINKCNLDRHIKNHHSFC